LDNGRFPVIVEVVDVLNDEDAFALRSFVRFHDERPIAARLQSCEMRPELGDLEREDKRARMEVVGAGKQTLKPIVIADQFDFVGDLPHSREVVVELPFKKLLHLAKRALAIRPEQNILAIAVGQPPVEFEETLPHTWVLRVREVHEEGAELRFGFRGGKWVILLTVPADRSLTISLLQFLIRDKYILIDFSQKLESISPFTRYAGKIRHLNFRGGSLPVIVFRAFDPGTNTWGHRVDLSISVEKQSLMGMRSGQSHLSCRCQESWRVWIRI
jgi:hypothetical protein